jgi:nucleoside-diphosphate-sugar epimerase
MVHRGQLNFAGRAGKEPANAMSQGAGLSRLRDRHWDKPAVIMMTEGRGFSNARAKRELGWQPRYPSWRQGFREGLA